jgi:hypothetical protein
MLSGIVFLAARAKAQPTPDYPMLAFVALLVVLGGAIAVGYWLKRDVQEEPVTDADLLAEFQAARDAGEMDEEEFRRVTAAIRRRMGEPNLENPTPAPPAPDAAAQPEEAAGPPGASAGPTSSDPN